MAAKTRRPRDLNLLAASIVADATYDPYEGKDQDAVARGRKGGQKGGKARSESLTPERRSEIAREAAEARWHRRQKT